MVKRFLIVAVVSGALSACASVGGSAGSQPGGALSLDPIVQTDVDARGGAAYADLASRTFVKQIPVTDDACEGTAQAAAENDITPESFNFIVTVAADGSVSEIKSSSSADVARCYRKSFIARFPKPPFAPFHLQFWLLILPDQSADCCAAPVAAHARAMTLAGPRVKKSRRIDGAGQQLLIALTR